MPDGMWITNDEADLSNEPDAVFASWDTLESGRAVLSSDELELIGSPDWVLEIVSKSSVRKDRSVFGRNEMAAMSSHFSSYSS
jgi:Uma2 family endonuclease